MPSGAHPSSSWPRAAPSRPSSPRAAPRTSRRRRPTVTVTSTHRAGRRRPRRRQRPPPGPTGPEPSPSAVPTRPSRWGRQRRRRDSYAEARARIEAASPAASVTDRFTSPSGNIVCNRRAPPADGRVRGREGTRRPASRLDLPSRRAEGHRPDRARRVGGPARVQLRHDPRGRRATARLRLPHGVARPRRVPQRGVRRDVRRRRDAGTASSSRGAPSSPSDGTPAARTFLLTCPEPRLIPRPTGGKPPQKPHRIPNRPEPQITNW